MEVLNFLHAFHIDAVIGFLSISVAVLRLAPIAGNLKVLLYSLQAGLALAQMYKIYKKGVDERKVSVVSPKTFVANVAKHYLDTHPMGKIIAKKSDIEEKVEDLALLHDSEVNTTLKG